MQTHGWLIHELRDAAVAAAVVYSHGLIQAAAVPQLAGDDVECVCSRLIFFKELLEDCCCWQIRLILACLVTFNDLIKRS